LAHDLEKRPEKLDLNLLWKISLLSRLEGTRSDKILPSNKADSEWVVKHGLFLNNKKAQLSLTNPRDAKACQKLLQFDVHTTLSLTILAYLHAFSCCCDRNLRNPEKFTENSNL